MPKITPFLWFNNNAEEAANFYTSIFPNSKITAISRYGDEGPGPKGTVMTVNFRLDGQEFIALNGGPQFTFTEAVSFFVHCKDQAEVDRYWDALTEGGAPGQCGWLKDKFGMSWQIVPAALMEMFRDKDPEKAQRVFNAMLQMHKLDVAGLKEAYDGK